MNVPLPPVRTDITGVTGLASIRALMAGERDPVQLARFRRPRWASRTEDIAQALTGDAQPEQGLALKPALAWYDASTEHGREGEAASDPRFQAMKPVWPDERPPLHRENTPCTHHKNVPVDDARGWLDQLPGLDVVAVPGRQASTVHPILSAIALEPRKWPHAKAFCSWLGLAPRHESSGGKSWRRRTLKTRNRAGQAFRLAAAAVSRRPHGWGAYDRRRRARLGPPAAIVVTAHTLARLGYHRRTPRTPGRDLRAAADDQHTRERDIAA